MRQVYLNAFFVAMGAREIPIEIPGKSGLHLSLRTF